MPAGDIETYFKHGHWKNKVQGRGHATSVHETKAEAEAAGREMALKRGVEHIIRNEDGTISERSTYPRSRDPRGIKG